MDRKPDLNDINESRIESEEYGPILDLDYRFFEYMQEGVIVSAAVTDDYGKVVDLIIKYANLAAYRQRKEIETGLIEKSIKEIYSSEEANFDIEKANEAISTGRGIKYETYRSKLDKHFSVTEFSPREDLLVTLTTDITERKKAEARINEERQKLLDIIEFLPDATFVIDENKKVIAWNKAIEDMTGVDQKDIIGKGDYAYSIPFYGEKRPIIIDLIFLKEEEIELKYSYVKREGDTLFAEVFVNNLFGGRGAYVFVKASPLYDPEGNLVGSIETVRDITEQKKAEMKLYESEEKFRSTIEQSKDGISIIDEKGTIIEWNKGIEIITGHQREEELGKLAWDSQYELLPAEEKTPELYDYIKGSIEEFLEIGHADWVNKPLDRRIQRPDSEIRFIQSVTYPIKTERGIIIGSITRDVTEQKKIEESLRESEATFRAFFELAAVGTAMIDPASGRFVEVNDQFSKITGYTPNELNSKTFEDLTHPDDREWDSANFKRFLKGEIPQYETEKRYVRKDGHVIWVHIAVTLIRDTQGKPERTVGIILDITERKKTEMQFKENEEKFAKAFYSNPAGMAITNVDGKIIEVNDAYANITGYKKDELLGKTVIDLNIISNEERENVLKRLNSGSPIYNEEREIQTKTGEKQIVLFTVGFIEYGGEKRVFSIIYDITNLKKIEKAS